MYICDLKKETLSVVKDGITYTKTFYKMGTVTGVTNESHPNYTDAATFGLGDYCIVPELKSIYKSTIPSNSGNFPSASETFAEADKKWSFYSYMNEANMCGIDEAIGSKTTGENIVINTDFSRCNTFALINTDFSSVHIAQIDNSDDSIINEIDVYGTYVPALTWSDWFFNGIKKRRKVVNINFDWHSNCRLEVTFSGTVSIETFGFGMKQDLFITLYGTSLEFESKSIVRVSDISQFRTVKRYGRLRVLTARVIFNMDDFNFIAQKIDEIVDRYILFIPTTLDKVSELIDIGYIERIPIPLDTPTVNETEITIIGVPKYD